MMALTHTLHLYKSTKLDVKEGTPLLYEHLKKIFKIPLFSNMAMAVLNFKKGIK